MKKRVRTERTGTRRPRRRTLAEIVPKGKLRIMSRREARRAALAGRLDRVHPDAALRAPTAVVGEIDPAAEYPAARAAVPTLGWTDSVSEVVAHLLFQSIAEVAAQRELCARDPERDFVRSRKIPLEMLLSVLVCWAQDTITGEMHDFWGWNATAPSSSAFVQQWKKLSDLAMPTLLRTFMRKFIAVAYLGKWRLLAADGTGLRVPATGDGRTRVTSNGSGASHDELHPTCVYDVVRHTFEDVVFQGAKKSNEPRALCELVDRAGRLATAQGALLRNLWLADRNFCTFNVVSHMLDSGSAFCLRAKDKWVADFLGYEPAGEFDITATRYVTRSTSPKARSRPKDDHLYRELDSRQPFDALPKGSKDEYAVTLRIVRVAIRPEEDGDPVDEGEPDRWLNLVTNLTRDEFPPELLERTYRLRWQEELGYLYLKHVIGMRDQHTHDYARLVQEVYGRMVLYNACSLGTSGVPKPEPGPKFERAIDLTTAFKAMMMLLRGEDADVEVVAGMHTHAVEPGRSNPRRKRTKRPPCFKYRVC